MLLLIGSQRLLLSSPPQPLPPAPIVTAEPEQSRIEQGNTRSGLALPFSLSFSVSLLYIPRFTCLCFLSSMLWQWCSMLMRQCVVQPQAVIFQVISRVMNTRLLLFHLPSRRSGFLLHEEGPLAMNGHSGLFLTSSGASSPVQELSLRPLLLLPPQSAGEALGKGWKDGSAGGSQPGHGVRGCSMSAAFPWGFLSSPDEVSERKRSAWGEWEEGTPLYPS